MELTRSSRETALPDSLLRSESGQTAIVVSLDTLQATEGVDVQLNGPIRGTTNITLLLTGTDSLFAEELKTLSGAVDLLATPAGLTSAIPDDFVSRGQIIQHLDPALSATFQVWEPHTDAADLLARGAPVGLGEGPDNLAGRADWFKKRHDRNAKPR